jgi:imidazolonepropionase-like amidohydrolase
MPFYRNCRAYKLVWFVKTRMTPIQFLQIVTAGAEMQGLEKACATSHLADLVAVEGDPSIHINVVIDHVKWVMKAGKARVDNK